MSSENRSRSRSHVVVTLVVSAILGSLLVHCGSFGAEPPLASEGGAPPADGGASADAPASSGDALVDIDALFAGDRDGLGAKKIAFITNNDFTGLLESSDPDELCAAAANAAGLPGVFVAWISTSTSLPLDRLGDADREWRDVNGKVVTSSTGLVSGQVNLVTTETGVTIANGKNVWTGTLVNGKRGENCFGWTSEANTAKAMTGTVGSSGPDWTAAEPQSCDNVNNIYCFEK